MTTPTRTIPSLPVPGDAGHVGDWVHELLGEDAAGRARAHWFRRFHIHHEQIRGLHGDIDLTVSGEQFSDGTETRSIDLDEIAMTPADARRVAAALIDAAERVEAGSQL